MSETEWKRARKRPIAVQFREVCGGYEVIETKEGNMIAQTELDYIIRGVDGELYPIKKDIFAKTYEVIY